MKSSAAQNLNFDNLSKENLHEAVKSGKVDQLIARLEAYASHPDNLQKLTKLMIDVDKSAPIRHFRKFWEKLPHLAQWAMMHLAKGPFLVANTNGPIELLIKNGFITYKGHLDENGQIMEEKIQAMGGLNKFMLKYGVKIGKYFDPKLAEIEPFIGPITKLQDLGDKTMERVRHAIRAARTVREAPRRNIEKISTDVRSNLQNLSVLPQDAANDNTEAEVVNLAKYKNKKPQA